MFGEDHLDIGAVARQHAAAVFRIDELHFDVDGARLLLQVEDIGRHASHASREDLFGEGVQGDVGRHADADRGGVHFVDRRRHVEAADVHQVHGRRRRDTHGRGRHELADLAIDLGYDTGERRAQACLVERGLGDLQSGPADLDGGQRGIARGLLGEGIALGLVDGFFGGEIAGAQLLLALGLAPGQLRHDTGLLPLRLRGPHLALGQPHLGQQVVIPELHEHLVALHHVALGNRHERDLAAEARRDAGASTRLDRASLCIGHGVPHAARSDGVDDDVDRLGPAEPGDEAADQHKERADDEGEADLRVGHGCLRG